MGERPALLRWKVEPDRLPFFYGDVGGGDRADRRAVGERHQVIPMRAEINLAGNRPAGPVDRLARLLGGETDIVVPERDGGLAVARELAGFAAQDDGAAIDGVAVEALTLENVGAADEARHELGPRPFV